MIKDNHSFKEKVLAVVKNIPKSSVMSYGEVAKLAGSPRAARAVGNIMKSNYDKSVPCHRVIRTDGRPGEYNRGARNKIKKLRGEDVFL